ncbi:MULTISPECIES: hypothetical protein [unclassified Variovorax]|uniref:hypothetical protein n=1 Tax=unclassified Variovorax TaxID=663243 RepID=UPI000838E481|nr:MULTISPECIES: hypothetical protein [unclassified Variovorax]PNG46056.1 hypothetical protein CHC06_08034 [Variovorax sp. B2]PNG46286.1 hypothetical protein CHC07_08034 [Variovorax sp. B4]VTV19160.1 hypothetical protein WDL1P3_00104 [Variovorax sp. WDL1]
MFPVDKRLAEMVWYPAPDVIPQLCYALEEVPTALWNSHTDLYELADDIEPFLKKHGSRKWDFLWSMERHFSEPYGPLPKAKQNFMAGIPDMSLADKSAGVRGQATARVKPHQFEPGSDLPAGSRDWLKKFFYVHGEVHVACIWK